MPAPANLYSYKFQHNLKVTSIVLNFIVLAVAVLVLCGWQFDLVFLRKPMEGLVAMHPLTAICLGLSASALILFIKRRSTVIVRSMAAVVVFVGLSEVFAGFDFYNLEIDNYFYYSKTSKDLVGDQPNVMSPFTAFNFIVAGTAILLLAARYRVRLSQGLTLVILSVSLFSLIGYIYGVSPFYSFFAYYPMAIHTSVCFLLLSVSILFARSNKGFMSDFISPYGGSRLARQLLPWAIIVPVILGLLRLSGEEQALYNRSFGVALFTVLNIIIFVVLIWQSMASINKLSFALSEEKATQKSNQLGNLIMNAALDAIICIDKEGKITLWNPRAENIFGWKKEEVLGANMADIIIPPELRQKHLEGIRHYLSSGESRILNTVILTTAIDKNNQILQIELAITKLKQGETEIFCGFIRDITERLKHLAAIEGQNRKLRDIAWTQSHVVRTPVANIIGLVDLLSHPSLDKATQEQLLAHLKTSAEELDRIIRDIVSKTEAM